MVVGVVAYRQLDKILKAYFPLEMTLVFKQEGS
jgi:hypothetical protein